MKKNGFTLIELLAVIVILAIIVLIAAPVVVDIIGDSKKDGILRGTSLYLKAVNMAIADAQMDTGLMPEGTFEIDENGNVCFNEDCTDKLIVKTTGTIPSSGTITIEGTSVTAVDFDYDGTTVVINERGIPEFYQSICTLVSGTEKQPGAKYECEVKEGTKYNFYALGTDSNGITSLIMDKNIVDNVHWLTRVDYENAGGPTLPEDWIGGCHYGPEICSSASYGPVTAMNALYEATKDWDNISNIRFNYTDDSEYSYSISVDSTTTTITTSEGITVTTYENLKARMLKKDELDTYKTTVPNITTGTMYWTLSVSGFYNAYNSIGDGYITHSGCEDYDSSVIAQCQSTGVRPVIELKL